MDSPVIHLLVHVWKNACSSTDHSWDRVNSAMEQALCLAIASGMKWELHDFKDLAERKEHLWRLDGNELHYALAVKCENYSACQSYESYRERQPFIADGIRGDGVHRNRERLYVGARFYWKGGEVKVTSFSNCGTLVVACSYKTEKHVDVLDYYAPEHKVLNVYKITREAIFADRAERKDVDELQKLILRLPKPRQKTVLGKLAVKTRAEFYALPTATIREAYETEHAAMVLGKELIDIET